MAGPITWRNVQQPTGVSEAASLMAGAQRSIAGGFDAFSDIIKQRESTQAANVGVQNNIQKQDFLDILSGARTPEELAALAPQIEAARAGLSAPNRAATREAEATRSTALMQQLTAGDQFSDAQRTRAERPDKEQYDALIASGQFDKAAQFLAGKPNLQGQAAMIDKAYTQQRTRAGNARADELAPGVQRAALATQALNETLRPQLESNARQAALLTGRTQAEQGRTLDVAAEDRLIDKLTAETANAYQSGLQADKLKLGALAAELKLPVDASGTPTMNAMNDDQIKQLNAEAVKRGLPLTSQVYAGDTASANQFYQALTLDNRLSPEALARKQGSILGAFNTTGQNALVGNDAALVKLKEAAAVVEQKDRDASNWYAPGSSDAKVAYEELAANAGNLIDKTTGYDSEEDISGIQNLIYEMGTVGLKTKSGKFVTPSLNDMRAAIRGADGGLFRDGKRAENAREILEKMLDTSRVTELIKQSEDSKKANQTRAVREIMKEATPAKK